MLRFKSKAKFVFVIFLFVGIFFSANDAIAQVKEINPNVQWRFIRSQKLDLQNGSFVMYEFPAEKGYDYVFNLAHNQKSMFVQLSVYNMQDKLIEQIVLKENDASCDLNFNVEANGTYRVMLGVYKQSEATLGFSYPSDFTLIRRLKT